MKFALLSGDVVVTGPDDIVVNLVLAAPSRDPVWSGIHELVVVNDASNGGDLILAGGSIEMLPGTDENGVRLGSIPVTIPGTEPEFSLSTVHVRVGKGDALRSFDVGDWRLQRQPTKAVFEIIEDYPVSHPSCDFANFYVEIDASTDVDAIDVTTDAPGLAFHNFSAIEVQPGVLEVAFDMECDSRFDTFTFSPRLTFLEGDTQKEQPMDIMLVGYMNISEETVREIINR